MVMRVAKQTPSGGFRRVAVGLAERYPRIRCDSRLSAGGTQRSCKREKSSLLPIPPRRGRKRDSRGLQTLGSEPRRRQHVWQRLGVSLSTSGTHLVVPTNRGLFNPRLLLLNPLWGFFRRSTPGYANVAPSGLALATCMRTNHSGLDAPRITPSGLSLAAIMLNRSW